MDEHPELIEMGQLGRAHGMNGEIRLFADDLESPLLEEGGRLWIHTHDGPTPMTVQGCRPTPKFGILKLAEVEDRDAAERMQNCQVSVAVEDLPETDDETFYQAELKGAPVDLMEPSEQGHTRREVGTVGGFFATGANDVLVLWIDDDPDDELFVPMIEDAIAEIDDSTPRVTLRPLEDWAPDGTEL